MSMPIFPIRPYANKMPSDLKGHTNGKVPDNLLVDIGKRNSKMHHTAYRGWKCLMWHAEKAGFKWDLASIDPRTYQRQQEIFDGRTYPVSGRYLPESMWGNGKKFVSPPDIRNWNGERWKRLAGTASAAVPGTSPHGWALAVDLAEAKPDNSYPPYGITEKFAKWLVADDIALRCGFGWSLQSEPWHLQWYVGDDVPIFVIEWENSQSVKPGKIGRAMIIEYYTPGHPKYTRFVTNFVEIAWVFDGTWSGIVGGAGLPVVNVDDTQLLSAIKSLKPTTPPPPTIGGTLLTAWNAPRPD